MCPTILPTAMGARAKNANFAVTNIAIEEVDNLYMCLASFLYLFLVHSAANFLEARGK